jgi:hypothetical protein
MDALCITGAAVGIAAPAAHYVHLLLNDLQNIVDGPETMESLKNDLLSVDQALASLQFVSDSQWKLLGEYVVTQSKAATSSCKESCDRFRTALSRWTPSSTTPSCQRATGTAKSSRAKRTPRCVAQSWSAGNARGPGRPGGDHEGHQALLEAGAQMVDSDCVEEQDPKDRKDDLGYTGCKD